MLVEVRGLGILHPAMEDLFVMGGRGDGRLRSHPSPNHSSGGYPVAVAKVARGDPTTTLLTKKKGTKDTRPTLHSRSIKGQWTVDGSP